MTAASNSALNEMTNFYGTFAGAPGGIALLNIGALAEEIHFEQGTWIRRANDFESSSIWSYLCSLIVPGQVKRANPFETVQSVGSQPNAAGFIPIEYTDLPAEQHRYHVLVFEGNWQWLDHIARASVLAGVEFDYLCTIRFGGSLTSIIPGTTTGVWITPTAEGHKCASFQYSEPRFLSVSRASGSEFADCERRLRDFNHADVDLTAVLDDYIALRLVEGHSRLVYLGLFAILESLLTHDPNPLHPADSITRQVKSKMRLIGNRANPPLSYAQFSSTSDTVWQKLYDLRSRIAHGSPPDFGGKLSVLKDMKNATSFVRQAVVAVMRLALREPELLTDLKLC